MGCDIHVHIEVKIKDKWEHYSCPPIKRCYSLFSKICGVRGDGSIVPLTSRTKGLPPDLSIVTKVCSDHENGHSHCYLDKKQFAELVSWADNPENVMQQWHGEWSHTQLGYLTGNGFELHKGANPPEITDVRFICWFDN